MADGLPVENGSEAHLLMHEMSQEALRITAEINGKYHEPAELRKLLSELWGHDVPESIGMFPPFGTDCGKNTWIGERTFINMGCKFQDQGGIFIGNDCLIGHNATLCTINHNPDPEQFTKPLPTIAMLAGYVLSFYLLSHALRTVPIGIAYAIWSALGIVLITLIGIFVFKQIPDLPAYIGLTLIMAGVIVINLFSKMDVH